MVCHKEWLAISTILPSEMVRGIRRTVQMNTSRLQKFILGSFEKVSYSKLLVEIIQWNVHPPFNKYVFLQLLRLLTDETRHCQWVVSSMTFCCRQDFVINQHYF